MRSLGDSRPSLTPNNLPTSLSLTYSVWYSTQCSLADPCHSEETDPPTEERTPPRGDRTPSLSLVRGVGGGWDLYHVPRPPQDLPKREIPFRQSSGTRVPPNFTVVLESGDIVEDVGAQDGRKFRGRVHGREGVSEGLGGLGASVADGSRGTDRESRDSGVEERRRTGRPVWTLDSRRDHSCRVRPTGVFAHKRLRRLHIFRDPWKNVGGWGGGWNKEEESPIKRSI